MFTLKSTKKYFDGQLRADHDFGGPLKPMIHMIWIQYQ